MSIENNFSTKLPDLYSGSILDQNCRNEWPTWSCTIFNVSGLISTGIWFLVLCPQLFHNFRRKSVHGLSLLWATANFTASFVNLFFVFSLIEMPLYTKISAVYMPTLEITILLQFLYYETDRSIRFKVAYSTACLVVWVTILLLEVFFKVSDKLVWISIALWSIETIPQLFLNFQLKSTSGQAIHSVILTIIGKMTDFISTYGLVMPIQYVIMAYFSSTTAYINGIQVVFYWTMTEQNFEGSNYYGGTVVTRNRNSCFSRRHLAYGYLSVAIVFFSVGLVWNLKSVLYICAPVVLFLIIGIGYMFIRKQNSLSRTLDDPGSPSKILF